jgi:hypothetical protein
LAAVDAETLAEADEAAEDLEAEAEAIEDERLAALDDADTLWSISPVERWWKADLRTATLNVWSLERRASPLAHLRPWERLLSGRKASACFALWSQ